MDMPEEWAVVFRLDKIPDLSLTRYSSLGGSGTEEILEKHLGFLRQFSRKPYTSIHLLCAYDPEGCDGSKLHIYIVVGDTGSMNHSSLNNAYELVQASPIAPFFRDLTMVNICNEGGFKSADSNDSKSGMMPVSRIGEAITSKSEAGPLLQSLSTCSALVKSTKFVIPTPPHPEARNGYYIQPEFTENEASRLFSMMKLMEALNRPVVYRVDLYPSKHADALRSDLPLNIIKGKRDNGGIGRNYELEGIERSYEKMLEKYAGSPLFNVNILVFSEDEETGRALLESAASEAIKKGSCDIAHFKGSFDPVSFLGPERWTRRMDDTQGRFAAIQHNDPVSYPGYYIIDKTAMGFRHSYITTQFTLEEAGAFFRLPVLEEGEYIQIRKETAPKMFDPVKEQGGALYLGKDDNNQKVFFEEALLKKHAFISGMPGSGKTVAMCHIATSLIRDGIPFMVLEPAKSEYRAILNNEEYVGRVQIFSPGANTPFPLRINPFEMPIGVSVGHHINRLRQVFEGSFPLESVLPFLLDRAIESVYSQMGWNSKMVRSGKEQLEFPTLSMLYDQIQIELERQSYDGEVGGNLRAATHMRIGGLLRRELGDIFDVPVSTVDPGDWLKISSIIELEALGASQSNFLTLLLCVLIRESLMASPRYEGDVRHVVFIEEAHNLIGPEANVVTGEKADPKMAATAFISDMLREVRALGEGMVIADQLPSAIAPEVLKNTGLKIALRITSADDRELLGSMMMASPAQLEGMAVANPGRALVMYEGLQRPFAIQMTEWLNDPEVVGYIEDKEARKLTSSPKRNHELRTWIQEVLEKQPDGGWYRKIGALTAWIDMRSLKDSISTFAKKMEQIADEIDRVPKAGREQNATLSVGDALLTGNFESVDFVHASVTDILRDNGYFAGCEIELEYAKLRRTVDLKTMNWAVVLPGFSDGVPTGNEMLRFFIARSQDSLGSLLWQIAYLYVEYWDRLWSAKNKVMQKLDDGSSDESIGRAKKSLDKMSIVLEKKHAYRWGEERWLSMRVF